MSLHYNSDNSYLFVNGKDIYKFKASNKNLNISSLVCLGSISNKFDYVDLEEMCMIFLLIMMPLINMTY